MKLSTFPVLLRRPKLAVRAIKRRLHIPQYYSGFGFVKQLMPLAYLRSFKPKSCAISYKEIYPKDPVRFGLPQNVPSRSSLSKVVPDRLALSFYDVPDFHVSETFVGCIPAGKIVCCPNQWGLESYAVLSADNSVLLIKGTEFRREHLTIIRSGCDAIRVSEATWVLSRSFGAYFKWLTHVLPRIVLANELGYGDTILYPPDDEIQPFMREALLMMGIEPKGLRVSLTTPLIICDKLNIVESDAFSGAMLRKMRDRLTGNLVSRRTGRRVYICRGNAKWRRCANEEKVWGLLKVAGFERCYMENLTFSDQVALMSEASVIIGLHGAGLANMIFCQEGTHVIEIVDPGRPNPHYYALACCLDHFYWYLEGTPVDAKADPAYRDLTIDISVFDRIVQSVVSKLV